MNFNIKQNEFCDIPGFDASRGERIVKALEKLWEKIQYLEQSKTSEKKSRSEASHSSNEEDLTLTDVQYKLMLLQLQYVRSLLRKKIYPNSEDNVPTSDRQNMRENELHPDTTSNFVPTGIPTASNLAYALNSTKKIDSSVKSKDAQVTPDNQVPTFQHSTEDSTAVYQRTAPSSSKPHYHLKLDDIPFILGASSTASHSVVANVQNIIAMMKSHNKALCGPKPNVTRSAAANFTDSTHPTDFTEKNYVEENSSDVTKMMNDLTRDLCALNVRQQKLAESYDATQRKKLGHEVNTARSIQTHENKIKHHAENTDFRKHRSNSESDVKLHAEVKKMPKIKEKDFVKPCTHPKQSANNARPQPSNLSIMGRRKLLRSLQNFKKHLSEEDISWN